MTEGKRIILDKKTLRSRGGIGPAGGRSAITLSV